MTWWQGLNGKQKKWCGTKVRAAFTRQQKSQVGASQYDQEISQEDGATRVASLRQYLAGQGLDAFVVPMADEYQNEYLPPCGQRLQWISGFTGSAGAAIVTADKAVIFVDGRYTIQVRQQVDEGTFDYCHLVTEPPSEWIAKNVGKGAKVGYDAWLQTVDGVNTLKKACEKAGAELISLEVNPLDGVRGDCLRGIDKGEFLAGVRVA